MNAQKFTKLIQAITGRDFVIDSTDKEIIPDKEYVISRTLPITGRPVYFSWKTAKTDEKLLRSFITAFCGKYREPNPASYEYYGEGHWTKMSDKEKEGAYSHHSSHMYRKEDLLAQVQENFGKEGMEEILEKYGFYATEYGIGIFAFWETDAVVRSILKMKSYLKIKGIPYANEFSDAKWVYRFKLNIGKENHQLLINALTN